MIACRRTRWMCSLAAALLFAATASLAPVAGAQQSGALQSGDLAALRPRSIGPAAMSGRMVDIAVVESDPYTFYVATATGGLWKTTNNGVTFEVVFEHQSTHSIGDVAVSQANPEIVWVGTGERANRQSSSWGDGLYKSTDGGATWVNKGLADSHHVGRVLIDPRDDDTVFVAAMGHLWGANEERGLYRTRDGGDSWDKVLHVDGDTGAVDVALDPGDPDILYAAMYQRRRTAFGFHGGGPGSGLYKSTDGGDTWNELHNGLPDGEYGRIGISVHRADPRIVYVSVEQGQRYNASTAYEERLAGTYRSEDRGETWELVSNWNPRPMYASQIVVDPSDDQRVYQMNAFSFSDDGGRTWTVPSQSIHSDDRFVWVNPQDSRHLIKASDGALAISYDRGLTWLWMAHLPVSQFYRVDVDNADPYNVYGGLQDNGSWVAPSATYRNEGILNEDWTRIGGGDGFVAQADPTQAGVVYAESQYLGLTRLNLETMERQSIRPGNPEGYKFGRRNWRLFGTEEAPEALEQEMEPANWNAPFVLSPHDPATIYAGTENLYVSHDRGASWRDLGRMSGEWERSEVQIMGQDPTRRVASLDDGAPYFATATTIAESPLRRGLLFVGTDDGHVRISRDGGATWSDVADRMPGLPTRTWVADLEPSSHDAEVVFAAFDGHRSDDFTNYLFRSDDGGQSWRSIVGDMPPRRVIRAVQQDKVNPRLLYAATELGFFVSIDAGTHWTRLEGGLPMVAINDFVIHDRDNDLVLGTHGRGVWILDNIAALRELTPEVIDAPAALFSIEPARMIRRTNTKARTGDMTFRGANPITGAIIDYWLADDYGDGEGGDANAPEDEGIAAAEGTEQAASRPGVTLTVHDASGVQVRRLLPTRERGVNRVVWDLRYEPLSVAAGPEQPPDPVRADLAQRRRSRRGPSGPLVAPGQYTVRLSVEGQIYEKPVRVQEDPRIRVAAPLRRSWTSMQLQIGELYESANTLVREIVERQEQAEASPGGGSGGAVSALEKLREQSAELRVRALTLRRSIEAWTGPWTQDQASQLQTYQGVLKTLAARWRQMQDN